MTARVLVVDDIPRNVKLLEAKLTAEYFEVLCADNGQRALEVVRHERPDIVLLDVMMPGMDGFEVCRRIKSDSNTMHIPVVMVTALDQVHDRVEGLQAGADDFLTKPVNDIALFSRVRSLVRLKMLTDELRMRQSTGETLGGEHADFDLSDVDADAKIVVLEDHPNISARIASSLDEIGTVLASDNVDRFRELSSMSDPDMVIISLSLRDVDGLRVCSQMRSDEKTRHVPILVLVEDGDSERLAKALEIGVHDYLVRPIDKHELIARARTQVRRKRYSDYLKNSVDRSLKMAVTDAVTGLFNRHYMSNHLDTLMRRASRGGKCVSVMMMDIDKFKQINDLYGHSVGDAVLREVSAVIAQNIRGIDLATRYGGEEFVVVMPDTDLGYAKGAAERLRQQIADTAITIGANDDKKIIQVTVSVGLASSTPVINSSELLIEAADGALYKAKRGGRNKVVAVDQEEPQANYAI
jgi:two-component system, cell cycle response regulator